MKDFRNTNERENSEAENLRAWNDAYLRFETPEQEIEKFKKRLALLGAGKWSCEAHIVELFCGRGNGVVALESLGFKNVEGVDLSPELISEYEGTASLHAEDCRRLHFENCSRDILIVQGGLHHLEKLPEDLNMVLEEARRVLRPGGLFVCVEPWNTFFLRFVHTLCRFRSLRSFWKKLDALAEMIEHERATYEQWLRSPNLVLDCLESRFKPLVCKFLYGKLYFVGSK